MPVIVQHVYIAQCQWCGWESVPKRTESAATGEERTHVKHVHGQSPWRRVTVDDVPWLGCDVPPEGWWCSREKGHEPPCAARLGAHSTERLPEGVGNE